LSTVGLISIGTGIFFIIQSRCLFSFFFSFLFNHLNSNTLATSVPRTMTKEWQVATNERAKEMNINPISGQFHKELVFGSRNNIILPRYLLGGLQRLRFCFEIKKTRSFFAFVLHWRPQDDIANYMGRQVLSFLFYLCNSIDFTRFYEPSPAPRN
jgi:hypothetical protein